MNKGFTLVELSIVLVLVGLIIGGVIAGKSLIHRSKILNTAAELQQHTTGISSFILKFDALPGDLPIARTYWPNDSQFTGFTTSNGDGNNRIDLGSDDRYAWQHLSLAKMVEGSFTGGGLTLNVHVPESTISGGGYWLRVFDIPHHGKRSNGIRFGKWLSGGYYAGALSPKDAYIIDKKLDDGKADKGSISTLSGHLDPTPCTTGSYLTTDGSVEYLLTNDNARCNLIYWIDR